MIQSKADRVTYDAKGRIDEIVGTKGAHLEWLGNNDWYLSIEHSDGSETVLWFASKDLPRMIEKRAALQEKGE